MIEAEKQNIYEAWRLPLDIDAGDKYFKRLLDVVFDDYTQYPVSLGGIINSVLPNDFDLKHTTAVINMVFYLVNMAGVIDCAIIHTDSGKEIDGWPDSDLEDYHFRFYLSEKAKNYLNPEAHKENQSHN